MKLMMIIFSLLFYSNVSMADNSSLFNNLKDSYWVSPEIGKYYSFDATHVTVFRLSDQEQVLKSKYKVLSEKSFKLIGEKIHHNHCEMSDDLLSINITVDNESYVLRKAPFLTQKEMEGIWEPLPYNKIRNDTPETQIEYIKNYQKVKILEVNDSKNTHTLNTYSEVYSIKKGFIFESDGDQYYAIEKKGNKILYSHNYMNDNKKWYELKRSKSLQFNIPDNSILVDKNNE